jgi:NAD(P)-dependent dehydrogenase (short-subunit alcohol dehydrogenase family)
MQKTILLTGVTGAIGKATALEAARTGSRIILLARSRQKLETVKTEISKQSGNEDITIVTADLSDVSSIKKAAAEIKQNFGQLHALVNIAAVYSGTRRTTASGLELMFATNHLGVFTLTNQLLDLLKASAPARVVTVSAPSQTKINFDDLQGAQKFSAFGSFGGSKMMNILFTYKLAENLKGTGVTATVYHPGVVRSEITAEMPGFLKFIFKLMATGPDKAAQTLTRLAVNDKYNGVSGKFFDFKENERKSSAYSHDKVVQDKLWKVSEELVAAAQSF